jgi:broad specificity phosphatase PhoE
MATDPSLDEVGKSQAAAVAEELAGLLEPCPIVTSPLARCQETASYLASRWGVQPAVEARIAEIPSPAGVAMADRVQWLRQAMAGKWADLEAEHRVYRDHLVKFVSDVEGPIVMFTHFVAINALIGHVLGIDDVLTKSVDNCSVTILEQIAGGGLVLVEHGREADTLIR